MKIKINDPVVRFVLTVIAIGTGLLLLTLIPYGLFALLALIGVIYYLVKRNKV